MRMRFWATIRNPAFSISALTAPVRLRAVASGLMIEKVRSVANFDPFPGSRFQQKVAPLIATRSGLGKRRRAHEGTRDAAPCPTLRRVMPYRDFTKLNDF